MIKLEIISHEKKIEDELKRMMHDPYNIQKLKEKDLTMTYQKTQEGSYQVYILFGNPRQNAFASILAPLIARNMKVELSKLDEKVEVVRL